MVSEGSDDRPNQIVVYDRHHPLSTRYDPRGEVWNCLPEHFPSDDTSTYVLRHLTHRKQSDPQRARYVFRESLPVRVVLEKVPYFAETTGPSIQGIRESLPKAKKLQDSSWLYRKVFGRAEVAAAKAYLEAVEKSRFDFFARLLEAELPVVHDFVPSAFEIVEATQRYNRTDEKRVEILLWDSYIKHLEDTDFIFFRGLRMPEPTVLEGDVSYTGSGNFHYE